MGRWKVGGHERTWTILATAFPSVNRQDMMIFTGGAGQVSTNLGEALVSHFAH